MAEPISDARVEEIFNLADEIIRAPSRFTKGFVIQELGRGVAELAGATKRARAELANASRYTYGPLRPYGAGRIQVNDDHQPDENLVEATAVAGIGPNATDVIRWSITSDGWAWTKDGRWIFEPQPSDRNADYIAATRWDNRDEAIVIARKLIADGHPNTTAWTKGRRYP